MIRYILITVCLVIPWGGFCQEQTAKVTPTVILKETFTYSDTLKLDYYTAKEKINSAVRPLIILVHGGGFSGGKRDNLLESTFSKEMAVKGFAVASMSYTLSRKRKKTGFGCNCPASEKIETFRITVSDILNATQFLVDEEGLIFDRDNIILAGSSAGAEAVLMTAYQQEDERFSDLPYGDLKFAAVVSFSGAMLDASKNIRLTENAIPAFLVHGKNDKLVPFNSAPHHYCNDDQVGYLEMDGSAQIALSLDSCKASTYLFTDNTGNHDWANKGYTMTEEISQFLKDVVVDQKHKKVRNSIN